MNRLNKTFEQNQILTAEELNAITGKVDEIVALLSSLNSNSGITEAQVQNKINDAKAELEELIAAAEERMGNSGIEITPEQISIILNNFDENGNPIYNPAALILAINNKGQSVAGINADNVIINGDTTVTSRLSALDLAIAGKASAAELEALTAKINTLNVIDSTTIGIGDFFKVYADGQAGGISIDTNGGQYPDEIDISNNGGLSIVGESEYFKVGTQNGAFNVVTSDGSQQGVGFTGTINGIKFINGICVGTA